MLLTAILFRQAKLFFEYFKCFSQLHRLQACSLSIFISNDLIIEVDDKSSGRFSVQDDRGAVISPCVSL